MKQIKRTRKAKDFFLVLSMLSMLVMYAITAFEFYGKGFMLPTMTVIVVSMIAHLVLLIRYRRLISENATGVFTLNKNPDGSISHMNVTLPDDVENLSEDNIIKFLIIE